ncbi:Omp28-related outer membrane protein [Aureispira sp. CCB-E]|uniref:Omp28-related outer membrane protein n=1 Tax=Aureispira sp. CCB-E TaxID=3051121 RepID=UPI002869094C|nr:Omp28-related outer membrane protein [Aureispira sp. CCB-E]WMX14371.1 Omp28-related outer membrane protein [Aureispira sp. CCB-E]
MPKMYHYIIATIVLSALLSIGCEENPPQITPCQTDRVVLVEEFTGVHCSGCPKGHQKIKELQAQYPNKIIPIALHAGYLARPHNGWDFRIAEGVEIHSWSKPLGEPSINVNRQYFADKGVYGIIYPNTWAGPIAEEMCLPPDASIELTPTFDVGTRALSVTVDVAPVNAVKMKENVAISVVITENNVIAPQLTDSGWENSYTHNHMARAFLTDTWGTKIQEKGAVLVPYRETYTYTLPTGWDENNCHIVAFVHYQGDERYILQATEEALIP